MLLLSEDSVVELDIVLVKDILLDGGGDIKKGVSHTEEDSLEVGGRHDEMREGE